MPDFRVADRDDLDALVDLMAQYYTEDAYPFDVARAREAVLGLVESPDLGRVWVAIADERVVGYLAVTLGYSFEYGGRDAFIDELYLAEPARGRGLGTRALALAEQFCRDHGVRALHLEVELHRQDAHALYRRRGYTEHDRRLMTKLLP